MRKRKDHAKLCPCTLPLLDSLFGDRAQFIAIGNTHMENLNRNRNEIKFDNFKSTNLADRQLCNSLSTMSNDVFFCEFSKFVDDECK